MNHDLKYRLESLISLNQLPRSEIDWLVKHGNLEVLHPGLIALKGTKVENLWIILDGRISVHIDRGAGPKVVNTELNRGSVTGKLPYSRLVDLPGDLYANERTELLSISVNFFSEMIRTCPLFTAHTVHTMIDRARIHNTSAMQDEKLISIGRLAAGMAHELNNPASAAIRHAKHLRESQNNVDDTLRTLIKTELNDKQLDEIENMRSQCIEMPRKASLSPLQKSDLQDKISEWLEKNQIDTNLADQLADLAITAEDLERLQLSLSGEVFETALKWITASCSIHNLAVEIEQSANRIYNLVEAVKKFTYMDNLAEKELIDIESGICDSLRLLDSKCKVKDAGVKLEIEKNLPKVYANGAELNQVWFSLLDNALDAIPNSGKIHVWAGLEANFISVKIIDNGPGIPSEKIDKIFDPFYTTKPPGQGTGLGLDIARRLIRRYHSDISVQSQPGNTEFRVSLLIKEKVNTDAQ